MPDVSSLTYPKKSHRKKVVLPKYSSELAEFFGIMLGDGHLSDYQVTVTLGTKEMAYAEYIVTLMAALFGPRPKIAICGDGHKTLYIRSV